ncbi:MAG: 4Fe-4S ferredoxin [Proteobacteria bacterium]|nr:4Fe-4S ferredoxin [Pseudomonadota bacterium]
MKIIKINNEGWVKGLEKLSVDHRLFGPVKKGESQDFKELGQGEVPDLDLTNTRLSPKSVVYPQSQVMFEYTLDEEKDDHHLMKEVASDDRPRVVLGIRPCDAASFPLVKRNFDNPEYPDPFWIKPYEASTFVGLACGDPAGTCFCTSVGSGPFDEQGLDLLLVEEGDGFLAKAITAKGEALAKAAGWDEDAGSVDIEARKKEAEAKITASVDTNQLKDQGMTDLFSAPFWDDVAFACLNCGTCTYSCPTCWCFDIQDENQGLSGKRMRNWDSCMYPLFTLEGSGHNPRPNKVQRVRQRFMHKLKYYVDKYDAGVQCVGCGRCIRLCPVNIDIRNVCEKMNSYRSA